MIALKKDSEVAFSRFLHGVKFMALHSFYL